MSFSEQQIAGALDAPHEVSAPTQRGRLTADDEKLLARAWRDGADASARDRLVTANLGLVVSIAQRYRNAGVPLEELIAEGNLGLMHAVDGFDPDCGARFSTYAAYWIRQGIGRAFAANSPRGRLNSGDRRDLLALERATRQHYARTCVMPTVAELSKELGWSIERVGVCRSMFVACSRPESWDNSRGQSQTHPDDRASADAAARLGDAGPREQIGHLLSGLTPFEREAVELRFGLHGTEAQSIHSIGHALDRTSGEVRTALRIAMVKLTRDSRRPRPAEDAGGTSAGRPPRERHGEPSAGEW